MKSSKKKLLTIVTSFCVAVAVVVASVAAIFAALSQTVTSNFVVTYSAQDVAATVKANYIVGTTTTPMLTENGREDKLVFTPTTEETDALSPVGNIQLNKTNNWVVFEYIFQNDSNSIDSSVELIQTEYTKENVFKS